MEAQHLLGLGVQQGRYERRSNRSDSVELDPRPWRVSQQLGNVLGHVGRSRNHQPARDAIRLHPGMVESINNLGKVMQEQLGRLPAAIESFQAAVRSVPHTRERTATSVTCSVSPAGGMTRLQNAGKRCASIRACTTRRTTSHRAGIQEHLPDGGAYESATRIDRVTRRTAQPGERS